MQHLNTNTLIGNTDARGTAWHYRAEHQGEESNHYPGPIPVADVERRLFHWEAVSRRVAVELPAEINTMTHLSETGDADAVVGGRPTGRRSAATTTTP